MINRIKYMNQEQSGITLTTKTSFILGLVGGVLVLCSIGFFIMLGIVLGGDADVDNDPSAAVKPAQAAGQDVAPSVQPPAEDEVGEIPPITSADHVTGPADAPITLIEYSDFECPFCSRFHPSVLQAMDEFAGQIKWVYRHFPLSFHQEAKPSAVASECAGEQGKFWEYANSLYENNTRLSASLYVELAKEVGLNMANFESCLSSGKFDDKIDQDMAGGLQAGVKGTPGTIIIGVDGSASIVPGAVPYDQLKAMITEAR